MIMRLGLVAAVAAACVHSHVGAQLFTQLGGGVGLQGVRFLFPDTTNDQLYIAGQFAYANGIPVSPGILSWNGSAFASVGCGVEWDCVTPGSQAGLANPTLALARWNGDLYLGGMIPLFTINGVDYESLMRWDGTTWHPVPGLDGPVRSLKVIDGELIVAGWFEHAGSLVVNGLAKWDGTQWQEVVPVPPWYNGDPPNYVYDVEKFQSQWYLGGNISNVNSLVRWNGTEWETVDGGFTSQFGNVGRLKVHGDKLYIAGSFSACPPWGNGADPGTGIVAWDGAQWDDLDGGSCGAPSATVHDFVWWGDTLIAVGNFDRMGGQLGRSMAKWDGTQWCMMTPEGFWGNGTPGNVAIYHDSLYVGGAFLEAGGVPSYFFSR